jgi:hypothetical protein
VGCAGAAALGTKGAGQLQHDALSPFGGFVGKLVGPERHQRR